VVPTVHEVQVSLAVRCKNVRFVRKGAERPEGLGDRPQHLLGTVVLPDEAQLHVSEVILHRAEASLAVVVR
jgi:hypothetical protein